MLAGSIRFLRESGAIDKLSSVLSVTDSSSLTFTPGKFLAMVLAPLLADSMRRVDGLARSLSEAESAVRHVLALSPSDVSTQVCNNVHVSIHGRTPLYMSATISRSRCIRVPGNVSRHTGEQPQLCHAGTLQLLTDYSLRLYLFLQTIRCVCTFSLCHHILRWHNPTHR